MERYNESEGYLTSGWLDVAKDAIKIDFEKVTLE